MHGLTTLARLNAQAAKADTILEKHEVSDSFAVAGFVSGRGERKPMNAQNCSEPCPLCEADALDCLTRSRDFDCDGVRFQVDGLEYAQCRECGAVTTTPAQSRRNKRRIVAAHKAAAGQSQSRARAERSRRCAEAGPTLLSNR